MQKFTAKQYLMIDIANNYGLDKISWDDRLDWFDKNQHKLRELTISAKEPALYYAGVSAWLDMLAKKPTGYMISLDATSSGLQLLAVLTGDRKAAQLCNVVDTGERRDAYKVVYEEMVTRIRDTSKIDRDSVKDAIMTALYSSRAVPKMVFGEGKLLDTFYKTISDLAPAAWDLNESMLAFWNPDALSHDWVLPDNFHAHIKVMARAKEVIHFLNEPFEIFHSVNEPMEGGRALGANSTHSLDGMIVREVTRRCDYDPNRISWLKDTIAEKKHWESANVTVHDKLVITLWDHYKNSGYLSARILDHLNPDNGGHADMAVIRELIESLPKKPFKVISIHDCFRCHPNYGNDLREQYNLQLKLIAQSNILQFIISQILGRPVKIGKLDKTLAQDISEANYALS